MPDVWVYPQLIGAPTRGHAESHSSYLTGLACRYHTRSHIVQLAMRS